MSLINSETAFELNADQATLADHWEGQLGVEGQSRTLVFGKPTALLSMEVPCHQKDKKWEVLKGSGALGRPGRLASAGS